VEESAVKRVSVGAVIVAVGLLLLCRQRAAREEQLLWDEASTSPVPRDLR